MAKPTPNDLKQYFLKNKNRYSNYSSDDVHKIFEDYMIGAGFMGSFDRTLSGCYEDVLLQIRWEGFANGFRFGEDKS